MSSYDNDLDRWIPRLIALWRQTQRQKHPSSNRTRTPTASLPEKSLTLEEIREVAQGVKKLSVGLTRERQLAGTPYFEDPKLLGAYLLFYWPVSYAQARQIFGELPHRLGTVLDLGSGPGPMALAALDAGAQQVTAADRSPAALKLARDLAVEAGEALTVREWNPMARNPLPEVQADVVVMGHLLNELHAKDRDPAAARMSLLSNTLSRLKPGGSLVIIEPALKETTRNLLKVRDFWVGQGLTVRAPCFFKGPCPALIKESDWCHADRSWRMPAVVESIAQAAGIRKESLKMAYLVLAAKQEPWASPALQNPAGHLFRVVSEPLEGKGRQRFMVCGPSGRMGLALQDKHRNEANAAFFRLQRGDVVEVTDTEGRGDGLSLGEHSQVRLLANAGKALGD